MLVKFEEEEKKKKPKVEEIDIEALSKEAGKMEKAYDEEKINPTEEELDRLERELLRVNELKFGSLSENSDITPVYEPQDQETSKKVLSYLKRNA
jgi:hypothetical protein